MKKLFKVLLFFIILLLPVGLGIFGIKKFFPNDFNLAQEKVLDYVILKYPVLGHFFPKTMAALQKKQAPAEKPPEKIEAPVEYFTNQDIYKAVCEDDKIPKPTEQFIGCNQCPKSLSPKNEDYFSMVGYGKGPILKNQEEEGVLFMHGCSEEGDTAIVVRKGFGGWNQVAKFPNVTFSDPPLVFQEQSGYLIFVGKNKVLGDIEDKELLYSLSFKGGKPTTKTLLTLQFPTSLRCQDIFSSSMEAPIKVSDKEFSITLDVLGWQANTNTDCKINTRKSHVTLEPGNHNLIFTLNQETFVADSQSQRVLTQLEKVHE